MPNAFPTLKLPTQTRYRRTLKNHLLPAFGECRLCEIGTLDIQSFVLKKIESGLGSASAELFRNLVREKHILTPEQVTALLDELREPFHTMVLLAILTGLRVGEILGLRWGERGFFVSPDARKPEVLSRTD